MATAESPVLAGYHVEDFKVGFDYDGFEPIPVVALDERRLVSRHVLSDAEVEEVVRTRQVYLVHPHDARRVLPVVVTATRPEHELKVLAVGLPGGESVTCHGLDVSDAGGTEPDRQDYAAAEAAALVAGRALPPCRVALFDAGREWGDLGGEVCATRGLVEDALVRRFKSALAKGGRQVEARDAAGAVFKVEVVGRTPAACREAGVSVPG
jgi:hypothetical protein